MNEPSVGYSDHLRNLPDSELERQYAQSAHNAQVYQETASELARELLDRGIRVEAARAEVALCFQDYISPEVVGE